MLYLTCDDPYDGPPAGPKRCWVMDEFDVELLKAALGLVEDHSPASMSDRARAEKMLDAIGDLIALGS